MLEGMGEELTCVGVDAGGDAGGTHLCRGRCWGGGELTCVGVDAGVGGEGGEGMGVDMWGEGMREELTCVGVDAGGKAVAYESHHPARNLHPAPQPLVPLPPLLFLLLLFGWSRSLLLLLDRRRRRRRRRSFAGLLGRG